MRILSRPQRRARVARKVAQRIKGSIVVEKPKPEITPIDSFRNVIMFELQRTGKRVMLFSSLWNVCANAALNLPEPVDPEGNQKLFAKRMFDDLRWLGSQGFVIIHNKPSTNQIAETFLTEKGELYLKTHIFSCQDRMHSTLSRLPRKQI